MQTDVDVTIAERAIALVGVPFRFHGRQREAGLDCVGVVAHALEGAGCSFDIPRDYALRGEYLARISAFFDHHCFRRIGTEPPQPGDILLSRVADRQVHFAIFTLPGIVHAHAGLRRTVLTPLPVPWPVVGCWRYIGD